MREQGATTGQAEMAGSKQVDSLQTLLTRDWLLEMAGDRHSLPPQVQQVTEKFAIKGWQGDRLWDITKICKSALKIPLQRLVMRLTLPDRHAHACK
ncbi:MAG: hypothetical protein ACKO24_04980 [Leptolyngbyaceae cyanobacterium]